MSMRFFKKRRIIDSLQTTVFSMDSGSVDLYLKNVKVASYQKDGTGNLIIKLPDDTKKFIFKVGDTESFSADQYGPSHATYAE